MKNTMENEVYTLLVSEEEKGSRLDALVAKNVEDISRARVQRLLDEGCLTVNGAVRKANYRLRAGEEIRLEIPAAVSAEALPEDIPWTSCTRMATLSSLTRQEAWRFTRRRGYIRGRW